MNFYKHHLGDYDGATAHLTWDEDMAYTRLLRMYYRREKPIPKDPGETYRLLRAQTAPQKAAVTRILNEFFEERADGWHNKRADEEITAYKSQADTNRRIARQRTVLRTVDDSSTKGTPNHKPLTKNQEPETTEEVAVLPPWLPLEAWKAWLEVRKKNKAPNTPRALKLSLDELERLKSQGYDPATVLDQSTQKGWKSLYPPKDGLLPEKKEPAGKICDYCEAVSSGNVNGRRACAEHWHMAMDNVAPLKAALQAIAGKRA